MKPMAECNAPEYVLDNPYLDLRKVFGNNNPSSSSGNVPVAVPTDGLVDVSADIPACTPTSALANVSLADHLGDVNILGSLPEIPANMLDNTQAPAFQRMLTKELAIVQGPPGTGKTHISIMALKAILLNVKENDPPVIVTAQTNHALDQMLRHIAAFEPNFIRLGGRTKDHEKIKPRTLRKVRLNSPPIKLNDDLRGRCFPKLKRLADLMRMIMKPLQEENPLRAEILRDLGVITVAQYQSLIEGAEQWVHPGQDTAAKEGPIGTWLGGYKTNLSLCEPDAVHHEVEDEEPVWEVLREIEAEAPRNTGDDEDIEVLSGAFFKLKVYCHPHRRLQGGKIVPLTLEEMQNALAQTDLYEIPEENRGDVYHELWKRVADIARGEFERRFREYMAVAKDLKVGRREYDSAILRKTKVIGTTVTGFSKNRGLIASVKPRIVMLEEAAETLEGHVMSACVESVQHLILVG
jgi:helicase required for RNAi-mediated heterochromatin assembly 1